MILIVRFLFGVSASIVFFFAALYLGRWVNDHSVDPHTWSGLLGLLHEHGTACELLHPLVYEKRAPCSLALSLISSIPPS